MKNLFILLLSFVILLPACAKNQEKLDIDSQSFMELGRYVETLETNDGIDVNNIEESDIEDEFEQELIIDVAKRYEKNAVELKLDDINTDSIKDVNNLAPFKLHVNETQYKIENSIKNENLIWDGSKSFSQAFFSDTRHMAPIPSVINSSKISTKVSPSVVASLGQTNLYSATGADVLFIRANESTYNTGSVLSYKGDSLNMAVGSFSSSFNNAASGGAILSSNSINLPKNSGKFLIGSGFFTKESQDFDKTTGGFFGQYSYKRLKLNAQIGQSKYTNSANFDTSLYLIPEFRISDSIYLKTRFIRNVSQHTNQDELALTFKPKKNKNNLEFEINASTLYSETSVIKQRIKFSTSFKI